MIPLVSRLAASFGAVILVLAAAVAGAQQIDTPARHAYMIDVETGTVLLDKDGTVPGPPSSMSKLMTSYVVFDRIKSGRLSLQDQFLVSEKAWRMGGSKMFVEVGTRISIENLLRGVIVQSGNDACVVLAEGIAGTEEAFADIMNAEARRIGLTESHFVNASGWPADGHVMSARDIARVSQRIIEEFPDLYKMYSETSFTWHGIRQGNRNPLLYMNVGADGLKTGHAEAAGYGLAASAVRDGRRLILVVNGLQSMRQRAQEAARLMDWGFRTFNNYALFAKGDTVEAANVWLGTEATVPLVVDRDVKVTLPRTAERSARITVNYTGPIPAPIEAGAQVATLTISAPGIQTIEIPLLAGKSVEQLGFFGRLSAGLRHLVWGAR